VEESADRLTGLVGNLLDSSRLAAGAVVPRVEPVGYDEVVSLALAGVDGARRVVVEIDEALPAVLADIGLLERVVANVVDNALRHGGAPGGGAGQRAREPGQLRVVDSGPGVPKMSPRGCSSRSSASATATRPPASGSGSAWRGGFTEAMGGTLTAEDTPGGGLTVVISLPAEVRLASPSTTSEMLT